MAGEWEQAIAVFPTRIRNALAAVPQSVCTRILEVRLYAASPVRLTMQNEMLFLHSDGRTSRTPLGQAVCAKREEIGETILRACGYSLHSAEHELRAGFLPLPGGHRLAICGRTIPEQSRDIQSTEDVTALSLRVSRFLPDAAQALCHALFSGGLCSPILAGPPMSGKTTLLRSMAHYLSTGQCGPYYRVSVLDTRLEFSPLPYCDVLCGGDKATGIERALRLLSPQIIICDEIADVHEIDALERGFSAGCACAVSVHVGSREELLDRAPLRALLRTGQFTHIVLLDERRPGEVREICTPRELCA